MDQRQTDYFKQFGLEGYRDPKTDVNELNYQRMVRLEHDIIEIKKLLHAIVTISLIGLENEIKLIQSKLDELVRRSK